MALAVLLGVLAGFLTGWNFSLLAVLLLAALVNLNGKLFAVAWASGAVLAWLLVGLTYRLGVAILDDTSLGRMIAELGDGPVVAMLDWDRYALVGGAVLGVLIGVPAARAAWAAAQIRLAKASPSHEKNGPILRPHAWLAASATLVLGGLVPWWVGTQVTAEQVLQRLAVENGGTVTADDVRLSLWSGELQIDNLQIVDPTSLGRDRLRIGVVKGQLRPGPLLRDRLHLDLLSLDDLECYRVGGEAQEVEPAQPLAERVSLAGGAPLGLPDSSDARDVQLDEYVVNWELFSQHLAHLKRLIVEAERLAADDRPGLCGERVRVVAKNPVSRREARSPLGLLQPRLEIEQLRAQGLTDSFGLGRKALVEMSHITSRPTKDDKPTQLKIVAPRWSAEMTAELNLAAADARHSIGFRAYDLALGELVESSATGSRVVLHRGLVNLSGEGWADSNQLELTVHVESHQLAVDVVGPGPAAGIAPSGWNNGLKALGGLRADVVLAGRWSAPRLTVPARDLANQFKHQLRSAGEHQLVKAIDEQLIEPVAMSQPAMSEPAQVASESATETSSRYPAQPVATVPASPRATESASPPVDPLPRRPEATSGLASNPTAIPDRYPATSPETYAEAASRSATSVSKPTSSSPVAAPTPRQVATARSSIYSEKVRTTTVARDSAATNEIFAAPPAVMPRAGLSTNSGKRRKLPGPINLAIGPDTGAAVDRSRPAARPTQPTAVAKRSTSESLKTATRPVPVAKTIPQPPAKKVVAPPPDEYVVPAPDDSPEAHSPLSRWITSIPQKVFGPPKPVEEVQREQTQLPLDPEAVQLEADKDSDSASRRWYQRILR
jgi:hypothetical protein